MLKKIHVKYRVPRVAQPVLITQALKHPHLGYIDPDIKKIGVHARVSGQSPIICFELDQQMDRFVDSLALALERQIDPALTRHHIGLIDGSRTFAIVQVVNILNAHVKDRRRNLLSEAVSNGQGIPNVFPVHCAEGARVFQVTLQFDPRARKFDLFLFNLSNPDIVSIGTRVYALQAKPLR